MPAATRALPHCTTSSFCMKAGRAGRLALQGLRVSQLIKHTVPSSEGPPAYAIPLKQAALTGGPRFRAGPPVAPTPPPPPRRTCAPLPPQPSRPPLPIGQLCRQEAAVPNQRAALSPASRTSANDLLRARPRAAGWRCLLGGGGGGGR